MMYIEDYLKEFALGRIRTSQFDNQISSSLGFQILTTNKALTEKQGKLALRLLDKYKNQFLSIGFLDVVSDIRNPIFKKPFRSVDTTKSVHIEGDQIFIRFPFDQALVTAMREITNASLFCRPVFDGDIKAWKMLLNEEALAFVENNLLPKGFSVSDDVLEFIDQIRTVRDNMEQYIPMLVKSDVAYKLQNCLAKEQYNDLTSALIGAAKHGIYVHDDDVHQELLSAMEQESLLKLFTIPNLQKVLINNEEYSKEQLLSLVKKFDTKVAIFFDDDVAAQTLTDWCNSLVNVGVDNSEIAVYFRKPGANKDFNQAVKDLQLNKEAEDARVKWVFLSSKYPKSLFKNDKVAEICVFVDRHITTHYTTINVMNNSLINIRYSNKKIAELENAYNVKRGEKIVVL